MSERLIPRLSPEREKRFVLGIQVLKKWLDELILNGLSSLPADPSKIQLIAGQMTDYGLPGVARKWRTVEEKILDKKDWAQFTAILIGECLWLCRMMEHWSSFNFQQREDALSYAGISWKRKEIPENNIVIDRWICIGSNSVLEENLIISRHWFLGLQTKRNALYLQFKVNRFSVLKQFEFGHIYECPVVFYPGLRQDRIVDIINTSSKCFLPENLFSNLDKKWLDDRELLSTDKIFYRQQLIFLEEVQIFLDRSNQFIVRAKSSGDFPLSNAKEEVMQIISWSMHKQAVFVGEFDGEHLEILSVCIGNKLFAFR